MINAPYQIIDPPTRTRRNKYARGWRLFFGALGVAFGVLIFVAGLFKALETFFM